MKIEIPDFQFDVRARSVPDINNNNEIEGVSVCKSTLNQKKRIEPMRFNLKLNLRRKQP